MLMAVERRSVLVGPAIVVYPAMMMLVALVKVRSLVAHNNRAAGLLCPVDVDTRPKRHNPLIVEQGGFRTMRHVGIRMLWWVSMIKAYGSPYSCRLPNRGFYRVSI